jgi:site-specific DNA-cytosine methylase
MVTLENVEELDRSDVTDATHIVKLLRQWGYTARVVIVQARDFGPFAARARVYFLAVLARDDDGLGFRSFMETLQLMRIDPFPLDRFLIGDEVFQTTQQPTDECESPQAKK